MLSLKRGYILRKASLGHFALARTSWGKGMYSQLDGTAQCTPPQPAVASCFSS